MLFLISAFINCLYYFKNGSKEIRENEFLGAFMFGILSAIVVGEYIGALVKGYWMFLMFALPFEALYLVLRFKLKEKK